MQNILSPIILCVLASICLTRVPITETLPWCISVGNHSGSAAGVCDVVPSAREQRKHGQTLFLPLLSKKSKVLRGVFREETPYRLNPGE